MISVKETRQHSIRSILNRTSVKDLPEAEETLSRCLLRSETVRYGYINNDLAAIWGLIPPTLLSEAAYLWLLTTDVAAEHKFLLVRHSQRYVESALARYPTLVGDVMLDNEPAKRWLKWLGAEFGQPMMAPGMLVSKRVPFRITRKSHG